MWQIQIGKAVAHRAEACGCGPGSQPGNAMLHRAGERRAVEHEGVELAVLAAGVNARWQAGNEFGIELPTAIRVVKKTAVHAYHAGVPALRQKLVHQRQPRLPPQRQACLQTGLGADPFFPVAVGLQVDVAKHRDLRAARGQRLQLRDESGLVVVPACCGRHQFQPQGVCLRLH